VALQPPLFRAGIFFLTKISIMVSRTPQLQTRFRKIVLEAG
jgi:hypothetical protein